MVRIGLCLLHIFIRRLTISSFCRAECLANVAHWGVYTSGGHFGGMESPVELSGDIQKFEKAVRRRWGAEKL